MSWSSWLEYIVDRFSTDAKLARTEKPTYILQLCFYSDGIAAIQGPPPEHMHVLLGVGEQRALRCNDFAAYYRRVRAGFEATIATPEVTAPYPVEHCAACEFRGVCAARWETEDHLSQVANVHRDQVERLSEAGLPTLAALAQSTPGAPVERMAAHTFVTLRDQAARQLARRTTARLDWHAVDADVGGEPDRDVDGHQLATALGARDHGIQILDHGEAERRRAASAVTTSQLPRHPSIAISSRALSTTDRVVIR